MGWKKYRLGLLLIALCIAVLILVPAGCKQKTHLGKGDFYDMRKIDLRVKDKQHLLTAARAMLEGKSYEKDATTYQIIYKNEPRGVFLTLVRKNQYALTAFAMGKTIFDATEKAAKHLKHLAADEKITSFPLRIDLMDESTDVKTKSLKKSWKWSMENEGVIFDTDPAVALLPDELIARAVFSKKGKFSKSALKALVEDRGIGKAVMDQFKDNEIDYTRFTIISFMEDENRNVYPLIHGNHYFMPLTPKAIWEAVRNGTSYLQRNLRDDGVYNYRYFPSSNRNGSGYNLLRHCGTTYALTEVYEITRDPKLLQQIEYAHGWLFRQLVNPPAGDSKADWRAPKEPGAPEIKLGGAGLALLMLAKHAMVTGDMKNMEIMRSIARFIVAMQDEKGDFKHKYFLEPGKDDKAFSLFYPGEAMFGLMMLYQLDPDKRWLDAAQKGSLFIAKVRDVNKTVDNQDHDHWLCYAVNELYRYSPNAEIKAHAYKVGHAIAAKQNINGPSIDYIGGWFSAPGSSASATRAEGMGALARLARYAKNDDEAQLFSDCVVRAAGFLIRAQFNPINAMFALEPQRALGGFWDTPKNYEIEIDYVQHSMSALMAALYLLAQDSHVKVADFVQGKAEITIPERFARMPQEIVPSKGERTSGIEDREEKEEEGGGGG